MDISHLDYNADFIDLSDNLTVINEYIIETIPEYVL